MFKNTFAHFDTPCLYTDALNSLSYIPQILQRVQNVVLHEENPLFQLYSGETVQIGHSYINTAAA